jgi:hypothetical protein
MSRAVGGSNMLLLRDQGHGVFRLARGPPAIAVSVS